ncbi:MAG: SDR family oxidoreductase [Acidimicrobiales bacterium]|nr:SDR family oxidoreductase [Acidimicrobiales bacterium]
MDLGIAGRTALVAASSAGLGFEAARSLAREGARVVVSGRRADVLDAAVAAIRAEGGNASGVVADVATPEGAERLFDDAHAVLGSVEILVANAGGPPPGTFASTDLDAYRVALDLNLLSTVALCRRAVPAMQEAGWGRVVAITSVGARQPIGRLMASSVSRAGVTGFLKVLAAEVAADGVTVNSVQPGVHATDRLSGLGVKDLETLLVDVPAKRLGDAADFGDVVAFLCGAPAAFVTGAGIAVDGGTSRGLI